MNAERGASGDFWERPELVERFAAREADVRLMELLEGYERPAAVRILDLGCAAGRNVVPLLERGFDAFALDASAAMVARTRARAASIVGEVEAWRRIGVGRMEDLSRFPARHFDLVLGLGVYQQASSPAVWETALSETARALVPGGRLLYASFHPHTAPDGDRGRPVRGRANVYSGFRSGRLTLVDADALERALEALGLLPEVPSATVRVETETGVRVTVNGLFRKVEP